MTRVPEHVRALLAPGSGKRTAHENAILAQALMAIHACGDPDGLLPAAVRRGAAFAFGSGSVQAPAVAVTNGRAILFGKAPERPGETGAFLLSMVHELAHGVQLENGFLPAFWAREAAPEDGLLVALLMEAAATATAVDYGWKMYRTGDVRAMESLMDPSYAHAGAAWAYRCHVLREGPWSVADGSARAASVRGWFGETAVVAHYAGEACTRQRREISGIMADVRQRRDIVSAMLLENPGFHLAAHFLPGERLGEGGRLCRSLREILLPLPGQPGLLESLGGDAGLAGLAGFLPRDLLSAAGHRYEIARLALMAEENRLRRGHHKAGPQPVPRRES